MIVLDGPMGTALSDRGVATPAPGWSAYALETAPEVVAAIHDAYAEAGAGLHRLNTFRAQPRIFPDRYRALVARAIACVGARPYVATMTSIEDCYRPELSPPPDEARRLHRAMADALAEAGVRRVLCETFPNGAEAAIAVAESVAAGMEAWVSLTAGPDADLVTPAEMEASARACVDAGATAVLVACTSASHTISYVERIAKIGSHTGAYANAYGVEPAAYVAHAARWRDAGATLIGSCCGARLEHTARLADLVGR